MSNEEWERTMAFIVAQQAQFSVDIQLLRETQRETEQNLAQTEQIVAHTGEIVARLANVTLEGFKDVNAKINALVDSQIRSGVKFDALADSQIRSDVKIDALVDSQIRSDEKFDALAASQILTEEKLRTLITVVDRYFTEGRNGH